MESGGMRKNSTLICVPIMGETIEKMVVDMSKAKTSGADLVEVRLDTLKRFNPRQDLEVLIRKCPLPTLFTYRFGNRVSINYEHLVLLIFNYMNFWEILK